MELTFKQVIILYILSLRSLCSTLMEEPTEVCVVPKCCLPHQSIPASGKGCQNSSLRFAPDFWNASQPIEVSESQLLDIIVGDPCQYGKFRLEPEEESSDEFHILCNGSLLLPFHSDQLYATNQYCLESFRSKKGGVEESITLPLLCFPPPPPLSGFHKMAMMLYPIGLLFSLPFLVVTALVYWRVARLGDARGRSVSCQVAAQTIANGSLATILLFGTSLPLFIYVALEFVVQFAFVSCFLWLNVLCIDTWWILTRTPSLSAGKERARFARYALYAWAAPLVSAVVTAVKGLAPVVPGGYLRPNYDPDSPTFLFLYPLIGLLFLVDVCLLSMIVCSDREAVHVSEEEEGGLHTGRSPRPHCKARLTSDADMLKQCLVLFLMMGFSWSLEVISYYVGGLVEVWIFTITLNALHGVIMYIIFILRVPQVRTLVTVKLIRSLFNPSIEIQ